MLDGVYNGAQLSTTYNSVLVGDEVRWLHPDDSIALVLQKAVQCWPYTILAAVLKAQALQGCMRGWSVAFSSAFYFYVLLHWPMVGLQSSNLQLHPAPAGTS